MKLNSKDPVLLGAPDTTAVPTAASVLAVPGVWKGFRVVLRNGKRLQMREGQPGIARVRQEIDGTITVLDRTGVVLKRGFRPVAQGRGQGEGQDQRYPGAERSGAPTPLGSGSAQRWHPCGYAWYARQWSKQKGAWGDEATAESHLADDVAAITAAFRERGLKAGSLEASRRGLKDAAAIYVKVRSQTEEDLSATLAKIRARIATKPTMLDKLREAFVVARLDEVRKAQKAGTTPDQAVADLADIPRRQTPRWVPITAIVLSVVSLVRSFVR